MRVEKYLFDTTFDDEFLETQKAVEEAIIEEEMTPPPPTFSEEEMAACRETALAEGRAAGQAETEAGISRVASEALEVIGSHIGNLAELQKTSNEKTHRDALKLAAAIVRKTVPAIAYETAGPAIEDFIRGSLPQIMEEPRIVVRISEPLLEQIKEDMEKIAAQSGFPGQMIVISDPDLSIQDCRIEWADGGAERDSTRIWQEIDQSIERFLESQASSEPKLTENTIAAELAELPTPDCVS